MMPRFQTRRAIAFMIVAFLLQPLLFLSSAEDTMPGDGIPVESGSPPNIYFTDIQGHWAEPAIQKAVADAIVKGYGDGTFRPDQPITNAEFRLMLHRSATSAGLKWPSGTGGEDWPLGTTGTPGCGTAADLDAPITRQEAATLLLKLPLPNVPGGQPGLPSFPDWGDVAVWARDAMATITSVGYLTGHDDGYLRPDGILSRAEGATLLIRVLDSRSQTIEPTATEQTAHESPAQSPKGTSSELSHSPEPSPSLEPSASPITTTSYLRHLVNLITVETDGSGAVTSFASVVMASGEESFLYEQQLIAAFQVTEGGISEGAMIVTDSVGHSYSMTSNVAVWEARLTASNLFDTYVVSSLSSIAAGDEVSLYDTTSGAALGGKANLIIHHRGNGNGYGVVLNFYSPDTVALVGKGNVYFEQPRIRLKSATGETRNYAVTGSAFGELDLAAEEALTIHQLIQYHVNAVGEIDWVTPGAVTLGVAFQGFVEQTVNQNSGETWLLETGLNPNSATYRLISSSAVFVLEDGKVAAKQWESQYVPDLVNGKSAAVFDGDVIRSLLIDTTAAPGEINMTPDVNQEAATVAVLNEIMSNAAIGVLDAKPIVQFTVTAGGVDAASTKFTGTDGMVYRIHPDALVYEVDEMLGAYSYTRGNLFNIYPCMTLILYKNYLLVQ